MLGAGLWLAPSSRGLGRRPFKPETGIRIPLGLPMGAHSSAGERLLHTQEVAGSIPAAPTTLRGCAGERLCRALVTAKAGWELEQKLVGWRANSSAGERLPYKQEVTGSIPVSPRAAVRIAEPWCSWLAHWPVKPEVAGSSPVGSATIGQLAGLAQVVERGTENPGVPSSTLGPGTKEV